MNEEELNRDLQYFEYKLRQALDRPNPNVETVFRLYKQIQLMGDVIDTYNAMVLIREVCRFTGRKIIKKHRF